VLSTHDIALSANRNPDTLDVESRTAARDRSGNEKGKSLARRTSVTIRDCLDRSSAKDSCTRQQPREGKAPQSREPYHCNNPTKSYSTDPGLRPSYSSRQRSLDPVGFVYTRSSIYRGSPSELLLDPCWRTLVPQCLGKVRRTKS
jgi:hypothetical protein